MTHGASEPVPVQQTPLPVEIGADEFQAGFGEPLHDAIDLSTWRHGEDLARSYARVLEEIEQAVAQEEGWRKRIREELFPRLCEPGFGGPKGAGVYSLSRTALERVHRGLLFNGRVEACDGTIQSIDTIPITIYQIGVGLTSYQGDQGTWGHRLFRRDLRMAADDPKAQLEELFQRRRQRGGLNQPSVKDQLSELARRGIMTYAERAILLHRAQAPWRMGHGSPAPYELITGGGSMELMIEGTKVLRQLIEAFQKFIFVASEPADRLHLTIGRALRPLEFAIIDSLDSRIASVIQSGHYSKNTHHDAIWDSLEGPISPFEWVRRFWRDVASQVVVGVYRASELAPPQMFYAHVDHAQLAAAIAIADSMLQEHRGFPMLIDLADHICSRVFGGDSLSGPAGAAFAHAGAPFSEFSERMTRAR
jgi:hypothetical protein